MNSASSDLNRPEPAPTLGLATRAHISPCHKVLIEEMPDIDENPNVRSLPKGIDALLLSDEEYEHEIKNRDFKKPQTPIKPKRTPKVSRTPNDVRDTDKIQADESEEPRMPRRRTFWDQPIPHPVYEWPHDPRMPKEWNAVVSAMREHKGRIATPLLMYCMANDDEISEPNDFVNLYNPQKSSKHC